MKRMYNQPNLEQMQLQSAFVMTAEVSVGDDVFGKEGDAPLRRPNW